MKIYGYFFEKNVVNVFNKQKREERKKLYQKVIYDNCFMTTLLAVVEVASKLKQLLTAIVFSILK